MAKPNMNLTTPGLSGTVHDDVNQYPNGLFEMVLDLRSRVEALEESAASASAQTVDSKTE